MCRIIFFTYLYKSFKKYQSFSFSLHHGYNWVRVAIYFKLCLCEAFMINAQDIRGSILTVKPGGQASVYQFIWRFWQITYIVDKLRRWPLAAYFLWMQSLLFLLFINHRATVSVDGWDFFLINIFYVIMLQRFSLVLFELYSLTWTILLLDWRTMFSKHILKTTDYFVA